MANRCRMCEPLGSHASSTSSLVVGQALAPLENDDASQKKQRAGRDDADNKDGTSTTFQISSFTCIAISPPTCNFLICSHGRYFEQSKESYGSLIRCQF